MKILHVVQGYTPAIGGTELLVQKISERLVQRYGDEVTVFTTTAARDCTAFWLPQAPTLPVGTEQLQGVTVRRFPVFNRLGWTRQQLYRLGDWAGVPFRDRLRALFNGPIVFGMSGEIARFPADLIAASSFPYLHMHYALNGGKRSHRPVVLIGALHPVDAWSFERPMIYRAIDQAQAYIAHSRFERDHLVERGISASKIYTVGAGIEPEQFAAANGEALRAVYGWQDEPVIAYVGQFNPRKRISHLLAAMPRVWQRYPTARLLLAGSQNPYAEPIEQQVARIARPDANQVVIKSDFSEEEKARIFSACDLFVLPSDTESFGIVFLEAWACRKPVIGMRAGAIPTIVEDGFDGLLVAPDSVAGLAEAICQLLADPARRARLGQAGYEKVRQHYTWDIVAEKYRAIYRSCL